MPIRPQARQLQAAGRRGDELLGHLTPGELVLPQSLQSPGIVAAIAQDARRRGINPSSLMAGSRFSSVNPATGLPEFADQAGHEQTFQELVAEILERALAISNTPQLPGAPLPGGPAVPEGTSVPFFFDQVTNFNKFGFGPEAILRDPNLIPGTDVPRDEGPGGGGGDTIIDLSDFFEVDTDDDDDDDFNEFNEEGERAEDEPTSSKNPEDLTDEQLIDELTQSLKEDPFKKFGIKPIVGALTLPGVFDTLEEARDKQTLKALQDRGVLDAGLTLDDLKGVNLKDAITVAEAFEEQEGIGPVGFDPSLGGSAGDFEGVGFDTSLGGSAGDFEGVDFDGDDDTGEGTDGQGDEEGGDFDSGTGDPSDDDFDDSSDTAADADETGDPGDDTQEDEDPGADPGDDPDDDDTDDESDDTGGGGDTGD